MNIPEDTLEAFVNAWNERDAAARLALLEKCWAEHGVFSDAAGKCDGREALSHRIDEVQAASSGRKLEFVDWLEGLGGRSGFRWRLSSPHGAAMTGYATAEVNPDGRLVRVSSFTETDPASKEPSASERLRTWALGNPLAIAGVFVLGIYVALRLQAQRFYGDFGVTPEDAGFGPVDLVVRQSAEVLLNYARVGAFWSAAYLVGMVPVFYLASVGALQGKRAKRWQSAAVFVLSLLACVLVELGLFGEWLLGGLGLVLFALLLMIPKWRYPDSDDDRRRARKPIRQWAVMVALLGSLGFGTWVFVSDGLITAKSDADTVRDGGWVTGSDYPWRARPVEVGWAIDHPPFALPPCRELAYLGEANDRLLLYDRRNDQTLRVAAGDVELKFPRDCPTRTRQRKGSGQPVTLRLTLKQRTIRARAGEAFRVRYEVKRATVVRVSVWAGRRFVKQKVDVAAAGLNGVDLRVNRVGAYELVVVAGAPQAEQTIKRGRVTVT